MTFPIMVHAHNNILYACDSWDKLESFCDHEFDMRAYMNISKTHF